MFTSSQELPVVAQCSVQADLQPAPGFPASHLLDKVIHVGVARPTATVGPGRISLSNNVRLEESELAEIQEEVELCA